LLHLDVRNLVDGNLFHPQVPDLFGLALITRRPGQDRKVSAKAGDSSAGMWLVGPPPVSAIQQVTANTPFRPHGNPLHVDESGVFKVHFQLSSHAICPPVASMAQPSSDFQHCKLLQYAI